MYFENPMDDWYISIFDLEDDNVASSDGHVLIVEEEYVPALEGWFHRSREDDDDGGFGLCHEHQLEEEKRRRE
jgi:hypothetical protein